MSLAKKTFICVFGSTGWGVLTFFIRIAFLYGGQEGYVLLAFNLFGEMIFELFLITGIFLLIILFSFFILNEYQFENEERLEKYEIIQDNSF